MNKQIYLSTVVMAIFVLVLGACAPAAPETAADAGVQMSIEVMPNPPVVGESMVMIALKGADGTPIDDAALNIQGDMTHAGMSPVIRDVNGAAEGVYTTPFEWTMGGDWIVTVLATLADGTEIEQTFDLSVTAADDMAAMDHGDDGKMVMEMDPELTAAVDALDTPSIHDIDERLNGDDAAIEATDAETVANFQTAVEAIAWPAEVSDQVTELVTSLTDLKAALESEDLDAAKLLATAAHDQAHDLVSDFGGMMGEEHDHGG